MIELYVLDSWIEVTDIFRYKKQIIDFDSLAPFTSITNNFKIDYTKENAFIFEWVNDIESQTTIQYEKLDCKIKFDGDIIINNGILTILNANENTISVIIQDGNVSFFKKLGDNLITGLDFSDLNFDWTLENVVDTRETEDVPIFGIYDFGFNYFEYATGSNYDVSHSLPFIPLSVLFKKVIDESGFSFDLDCLKEDDEYIDEYKNLYVSLVDYAYPSDELINSYSKTSTVDKYANTADGDTEEHTQGVSFNTVNNYCDNVSELGEITYFEVKQTGTYKVKFKLSFLWTQLVEGEEYGTAKIHIGNKNFEEYDITASDDIQTLEEEVDLELNAGDILFLYGELIKSNITYFSYSDLVFQSDDDNYFKVVLSDNIKLSFNSNFPVSNNLPNVKQKDIIYTVMYLFNLLFKVTNNTIEFYKYSNYQDNIKKGNVIDLSDKDILYNYKQFDSKFAKENILKYSDNENLRGIIPVDDYKLADTKTLFDFPFENAELLQAYEQGTNDEDDTYSINFSKLDKGLLCKKTNKDINVNYFSNEAGNISTPATPATYSRNYLPAIDRTQTIEEIDTHTIPTFTPVNLQDHVDNNYGFLTNTLNAYKALPIEIKLTGNDLYQMNLLYPVYIKGRGYFIIKNVDFQKNKLSRKDLIKINKSGFVREYAESDFNLEDFDGRDFQ